MNIAVDISPLQTGHKVRGVGFYLQHLKDALVRYFPEHEYYFFTKQEEIPDIAEIVHYPYFDPFFLTLPFFQKKKTVVTVHDLTPIVFHQHFPAGIRGNLIWQMQRLALRNAAAIITDSNSSTKDVAKYTRIPTNKIHTVYLAAGEEFRQMANGKWQMEIIKKYHLPEKFVLYVGDVTWNKNVPRLVSAVKTLDAPLVMVGKALNEKEFDRTNVWNADRVKLEQLIAQEDKKVIKLGFVPDEDLVALYNAATVFVFPSVYEGFGLPVLEAMQCGSPVVTTKGGSLPEVAGDAAYFVDGYDTVSIAQGIHEVFASKELQESLSKKGIEQAKKFDWKKTAQQTIEVYKEVLTTDK